MNTTHTRRQRTAGESLTGRRAVLGALAFAGVTAIWRPARIFAQEATPPAPPLFTGETFVGETSDPDTLVAIILGGEAGSPSREARGYLCNGLERTIDVWLTGTASGDLMDLTADDGSRLSGVLNPAGIGGGAMLPDGPGLVFTALPATGLAGLYTVTTTPDGRMAGDSAAGATLTGTLVEEDVPAGGRFRYDVTVATPDGETVEMTIGTATTEEGEFRTILLPDGRGKGQGKTKRTKGWVDPDPQP